MLETNNPQGKLRAERIAEQDVFVQVACTECGQELGDGRSMPALKKRAIAHVAKLQHRGPVSFTFYRAAFFRVVPEEPSTPQDRQADGFDGLGPRAVMRRG